MTIVWDGEFNVCIINIFIAGFTLSQIGSFPIQLEKRDAKILSFSPATYHIFIHVSGLWQYNQLIVRATLTLSSQ